MCSAQSETIAILVGVGSITSAVLATSSSSDIGLGAVFQQLGDQLITMVRASRTLSPVEHRYSPGESEAYACLFAYEKWHLYLWGHHFIMHTDHQALVAFLTAGAEGCRPLRISKWCSKLAY